ncbi:uncharacterized protein LOC112147269 [Oryzias melastigma]|uniref:uncharacterized protein LOC112147269 n=1 Tax=Oryzias melastigma TaxID=30732 RepID=UPI000CF8283C|nr:uncharacterized protein LOC112147269 [Oryzias melastigma]
MAFIWDLLVCFCLGTAMMVNAELRVDCRPDYMSLVWTDGRSQADPSLFRLGSCFPTTVGPREATFSVTFDDCNFRRLVTGNELNYTNELIYTSSPDSYVHPFSLPVVCSFERPKDWYPLTYDPVFSTYGVEDLIFHIGLMKADFSGPAESNVFPLGSMIPILAAVDQQAHQPLLLLLEECTASTTPDLHPGANLYPLITNKGCLVDSKVSRSKFEPRRRLSEIDLSIQAFRFALGQEVFIHCSLVAWDPNGLDDTKKACHYTKDNGWELLDNPAYNNLCDCCESTCKSRKRRNLSEKHGLAKKAVVGPLTITA